MGKNRTLAVKNTNFLAFIAEKRILEEMRLVMVI